jgi:hypothetical protein
VDRDYIICTNIVERKMTDDRRPAIRRWHSGACRRDTLDAFAGQPEAAREQLDDGYQHGGGWRPMESFTLGDDCELLYPGDPPFVVRCGITLRDELIFIYDCGIVAICQLDGSFEVARMD